MPCRILLVFTISMLFHPIWGIFNVTSETRHCSFYNTHTSHSGGLFTRFKEHLHTEADAEVLFSSMDCFFDKSKELVFFEVFYAFAEGADTGKDDCPLIFLWYSCPS